MPFVPNQETQPRKPRTGETSPTQSNKSSHRAGLIAILLVPRPNRKTPPCMKAKSQSSHQSQHLSTISTLPDQTPPLPRQKWTRHLIPLRVPHNLLPHTLLLFTLPLQQPRRHPHASLSLLFLHIFEDGFHHIHHAALVHILVQLDKRSPLAQSNTGTKAPNNGTSTRSTRSASTNEPTCVDGTTTRTTSSPEHILRHHRLQHLLPTPSHLPLLHTWPPRRAPRSISRQERNFRRPSRGRHRLRLPHQQRTLGSRSRDPRPRSSLRGARPRHHRIPVRCRSTVTGFRRKKRRLLRLQPWHRHRRRSPSPDPRPREPRPRPRSQLERIRRQRRCLPHPRRRR